MVRLLVITVFDCLSCGESAGNHVRHDSAGNTGAVSASVVHSGSMSGRSVSDCLLHSSSNSVGLVSSSALSAPVPNSLVAST